MDTAAWIAKLEVQEVSQRYAHYCDTGEIDRLVDLFATDGTLDESAVGTPVVKGHAALRAFFAEAVPRNSSLFHLGGNYIVELRDDDFAVATHWFYFEGIRVDRPTETRIIKGFFYEELQRQGDTWKLALKRLGLLAPVQWSATRALSAD